jgi:hypothetical protein
VISRHSSRITDEANAGPSANTLRHDAASDGLRSTVQM